ncbi:unnamed protein product [Didymodactylos carnosus]|uniref:ER lumen protein-retaining receptor n=1 Tax=Didymodactylos carnosus TaxID=1234261 RepID=A0A8S2J9F4_9BILA|nr:unnamed protein product [Didymodactylos carnosus]CAF3798165.1 unnamed protein product [Didymodactylos carnosus]
MEKPNMCRSTYDRSHDTFHIEFPIIISAVLSLIWNHEFSVLEILWTFSIYLESVAVLPQLFMVSRTGEAETITSHYLFALGIYRFLYILNWIYRYYTEGFIDWISIVSGCMSQASTIITDVHPVPSTGQKVDKNQVKKKISNKNDPTATNYLSSSTNISAGHHLSYLFQAAYTALLTNGNLNVVRNLIKQLNVHAKRKQLRLQMNRGPFQNKGNFAYLRRKAPQKGQRPILAPNYRLNQYQFKCALPQTLRNYVKGGDSASVGCEVPL